MLKIFIDHNLDDWCVPIVQGFVGAIETQPTMLIISRRSRFRSGPFLSTCGIDDDGNVANFVETELIFQSQTSTVSFVQVRGSVPIFWENMVCECKTWFFCLVITNFNLFSLLKEVY